MVLVKPCDNSDTQPLEGNSMNRYSISLAAAMLFAGSAVFAQVSSNPVVNDFVTAYSADGFTRFEVRSGLTQVKIEAYRGTEKVEVILDKTTGEVLKSETEAAGLFDDNTPGVFIRERNRDFLRLESDDDSNDDDEDEDGDDSDDDSSDDDSSDDDTSDDDSSGGSDGSSDDSNDDNGGDSDSSDDSNDDDSNDDDSSDDDSSDDDTSDDDSSGGSDGSSDDSNDDNGGDSDSSDDSNDDDSNDDDSNDDNGDDD
jgi:hypothetical protein